MKRILVTGLSMITVCVVLAIAIFAENDRKHEDFLAETDAFIARIEKEQENDRLLQAYKREQAAVMGNGIRLCVPETETYCDPLAAEYEAVTEAETAQPEAESGTAEPAAADEHGTEAAEETESDDSFLEQKDFYNAYRSTGDISWADCAAAAEEAFGMDEYTVLIAAGWTVTEAYTWHDAYLAYLCAMCPWHYWTHGYASLADGLAGYDRSGTYSEGNLVAMGQRISPEELKVLWLAIKHPRLDIYECNGMSWYGSGCIYENLIGGYVIRVWAE